VSSPGPTFPVDKARLAATRFTDIRIFDEVGSTNTELMEAARAGAPEGVVMVADHQRAGRGRLGRTWSAAPGTSLLVSVLLRPSLPADEVPLVNTAAGLAAADAVQATGGFRPGLKWPNDLVVPGARGVPGSPGARGVPVTAGAGADRKLAGMLSESSPTEDGGPPAVVVGLGFNVTAGAYPGELAGLATSCEEEAGRPVGRALLLMAFLEALERRYSVLLAGGAQATLDAYQADSATLGCQVRVELATGTVEGVAGRLAGSGELIVTRGDGEEVRVSAGDVIHLRPA
jgi:BirA family biotin operon repressor/biotin-[acetyl-CoA-carboxylase] ligase